MGDQYGSPKRKLRYWLHKLSGRKEFTASQAVDRYIYAALAKGLTQRHPAAMQAPLLYSSFKPNYYKDRSAFN